MKDENRNEKLMKSEKKFEIGDDYITILDAITEVVFMLDKFGKQLYFNKQIENLLGYKREEIIGKSFTGFVPKSEIPKYFGKFKEIFFKKEISPFEVLVLHNNGSLIPIEISGRIVKYKNKTVALGTIRDISERKRTNHALIENQRHLELIFDSSPAIMLLLNEKTEILKINKTGLKFVGANLDEIKGFQGGDAFRCIFALQNQEGCGYGENCAQCGIRNTVNNTLQTHKPNHKVRANLSVNMNGIQTNLSVLVSTIVITHVPVNILVTIDDITQLDQTQNALIESEKNFRVLFENSPLGTYTATPDGKILKVNHALLKILGSASIEATRQINVLEFPPLKENGYADKFRECINTGKIVIFDILYKSKWGKDAFLSSYIVPLKNDNGKVVRVYTIMEDITFQKKNEEELKKAKAEADKANKAKGEFLSNMSHELRTPLNSILGYNQILRKADNITDKQKKYIDIALSSGQHLLDLIDDILDLSKIEAGKQELHLVDFNLQNLINNVFDIIKIHAEEKGLYFNYNIINRIPEIVYGDYRKVKQILLNILSNAVKYTSKGGIDFFVATKKDVEKTIVFKIKDTGIGILKEKLKVIFEPFNQLGITYDTGTGLGLAITKNFIELMKGKLSISSTPGKGSCFTVELPFNEMSNIPKRKELKRTIQSSDNKAQKEKKIPSIGILNKIISETEKGDYKKLEQIIIKLRKEDEAFGIFCDSLNNLVKKYDENSIIEYINILKTNNKEHYE